MREIYYGAGARYASVLITTLSYHFYWRWTLFYKIVNYMKDATVFERHAKFG